MATVDVDVRQRRPEATTNDARQGDSEKPQAGRVERVGAPLRQQVRGQYGAGARPSRPPRTIVPDFACLEEIVFRFDDVKDPGRALDGAHKQRGRPRQ